MQNAAESTLTKTMHESARTLTGASQDYDRLIDLIGDARFDLNRRAFGQLPCEKKLVIVPGATHLFEEPGTLDEVARLAREWFVSYLIATEERANFRQYVTGALASDS